jgi:hypothetical protein
MVARPERPACRQALVKTEPPAARVSCDIHRPGQLHTQRRNETEWHSRPATSIPLNGIYRPRGSMTLDQCENLQGKPSVRINSVGLAPTPVRRKCTSTPTTSTRSYS